MLLGSCSLKSKTAVGGEGGDTGNGPAFFVAIQLFTLAFTFVLRGRAVPARDEPSPERL